MRQQHEWWSERLPEFVEFLEREVPPSLSLEEIAKRALTSALSETWSSAAKPSVEDLEAERLLLNFRVAQHHHLRYAVENQLVRLSAGLLQPELTGLSRTLLRLSAADAVRWLLLLETERSTGAFDHWRASRELLRVGLDGIEAYFDQEAEDLAWRFSEKTLSRLVRLGVLQPFRNEDEGIYQYKVIPAMRPIVGRVIADDPWRAAVRAALNDEVQQVVLARSDDSVRATSELARLVTHEVRNALVPARHHTETLLAESQPAERGRVEKALRGINRALHFVEDLMTVSEAVNPERMKGPVRVLVESVVRVLDGAERVQVEGAASELNLPREPLSRALRNVVQNALQMSTGGVMVRWTVERASLLLTVDDAGPGVAPELRERIFEDGFTTREGGTGYGLAMTRRLLVELGGSVACEVSSFGGARFVLALPLESTS